MASLFDNLKYFAKGVQTSIAPQRFNVPTNIVAKPKTSIQQSVAQSPRQSTSAQVAAPRQSAVLATSAYRPPTSVSAPTFTPIQAAPSGGGNIGGGGQSQSQQQQSASQDNSQQYQEQAPEAPSIDFDALIRPALDALSQAESATQASGEADISAIESGATTQKTNLGSSKTSAERQLASRQASTQSAGEQAINESRRAAAELQQGLASRYGASSSTGLGASAIVGAESARTIGAQRAQLTAALNEVEVAKTGIVETYNNALKEVDNTTATLKAQARSTLQTNLAQIGQSRAVLQSKKAELVYNAMETYRQEVNAVNQRNTAFKQTLFTQQQDANNKIAQIEAQAKNRLSSLSIPDFSLGNDEFDRPIKFNPRTGEASLLDLTGATTTTEKPQQPGVGQLTPEEDQFLNQY